jgi:hypothetical protein
MCFFWLAMVSTSDLNYPGIALLINTAKADWPHQDWTGNPSLYNLLAVYLNHLIM